jgi:hypothetical protein
MSPYPSAQNVELYLSGYFPGEQASSLKVKDYITDYRSEDYKKAASSDSEAAKSSGSKPSPSEADSSSPSTSGSGKMGSKTDSTSD